MALRLGLLLLSLLAASTAHARPFQRLGPLPGRTWNPLYLLQLQPSPGRATPLAPGSVVLDSHADWVNLLERINRSRYPDRPYMDVDVEFVRTEFSGRVGLPFGFELGFAIPTLHLGGGVTDGFLQWYHHLFNLENGGRQRVPDGRFWYEVGLGDGWDFKVPGAQPWLLGDISLEAQAPLLPVRGTLPALAARLLLKLPTGPAELGGGSGAPDVGVVVVAEHGWRWFSVYAQVGLTAFGRSPTVGPIQRPVAFTWAFVTEYNLARGLSAIIQFQGSSRFHVGFSNTRLDREPLDLVVGLRGEHDGFRWHLAMGQDPQALDPSADVVLTAGLGAVLGAGRPVDIGETDPFRAARRLALRDARREERRMNRARRSTGGGPFAPLPALR